MAGQLINTKTASAADQQVFALRETLKYRFDNDAGTANLLLCTGFWQSQINLQCRESSRLIVPGLCCLSSVRIPGIT